MLELASVLAGPGVGQFFAELGATVIKVENLKTSGDVTRTWKTPSEKTDDRSAYFCSVNWGKQSIAIDLSSPDGQRVVARLAAVSDIVIASFKPGDAGKLRVDYETLSSVNPGIIYGQVTGYGSHNQRVGYDAIIQAEAGFMSLNGEPGGGPLKMPVALMDVLAGHQLKQGLLVALLEKHATGKGKLVEVSLIESAVSSLANQAGNYLVGGKIPTKQGSAHPNIAPYGDIFETSDGKQLLLAVGTDRQFVQLLNTLKINHLEQSDLFRDNASRVVNRPELNRILQAEIVRWKGTELLGALNLVKVPAAMIRNVAEALADPDVSNILISQGGLRGVRTYVVKDSPVLSGLLPPPHLGEHSKQILEQMLNYSPSDVESLIENGIIQ